jgi:hypothetical protein
MIAGRKNRGSGFFCSVGILSAFSTQLSGVLTDFS